MLRHLMTVSRANISTKWQKERREGQKQYSMLDQNNEKSSSQKYF